MKTRYVILLLIVLGFAAYGNSLNGKFIRDDRDLIKDNINIKIWPRPLGYFTGKAAMGGRGKWSSYRPLQMLTYAADYSVWKLSTRGYHLTNIVLHIMVAAAIYRFINILFGDRILSLFTSVLFVTNPLHTEAVSYISGRADSLSALFMLLAFIFYLRNNMSAATISLMSLFYILALLSRESSLVFPALLLVYHYGFKRKLKMNAFLPVAGISIIYAFLRLTVLRSLLSDILCSSTTLERIPGFFVGVMEYVRLLVLPFNLHAAYGSKLFGLGNPKTMVGIFLAVFLLTYAFRKRNTHNLAFFSICWFFTTLLPQSNIYPLNAYMAEHWLYVPSIGFFLIVARGLSSFYRTGKFKNFVLLIATALTCFYLYLTIKQNEYWKEPLAFFDRAVRYSPDNYGDYNNLGITCHNGGKTEEAILAFREAIKIKPDHAKSYSNLGIVYHDIGETEKAIAAYKKAIKFDPSFAEAYNNLGVEYHHKGEAEEAIASYKKAIEFKPDIGEAYNNLGSVYRALGRQREAILLFKKAVEINPFNATLYYNLGVVYDDIGETQNAAESYKKALELGYKAKKP